MKRWISGYLVFRPRTDRARNHSRREPAGNCTRLTCTFGVEVLGRYSNQGELASHLQELGNMTPEGEGKPHHVKRQVQRRLRQDEIKDLVARYQAGSTVYELADQFRIHRVTVSKLLERESIPRRYRVLDDAAIEQAVRLYQDAQSLAAIGHKLKVDPGTVRAGLLKAGVRMRDCQGREQRDSN